MPDKNLEQIESGNGRQEIWEHLMAAAALKPICGWGFACVERTVQSILKIRSCQMPITIILVCMVVWE